MPNDSLASLVYANLSLVELHRRLSAKAGGAVTFLRFKSERLMLRRHRSIVRGGRRPVVTLLPEFGGAYGWLKRGGRAGETDVGPSFADAIFGWTLEVDVPEKLHRACVAWVAKFERFAHDSGYDWNAWPGFPWAEFHREGLRLAHQVKHHVGDRYIVIYLKPGEDPNRDMFQRREVMNNGRLLPRLSPMDATNLIHRGLEQIGTARRTEKDPASATLIVF